MGTRNMAVGKNKGLSKGGKKKGAKKPVDPFLKKEWYDVIAPGFVKTRSFCKTIASKSQGLKLASENLKGQVYRRGSLRQKLLDKLPQHVSHPRQVVLNG